MRHNGERSPEEIEQEIARTRGDMDATLTAIEQRLTPGQIVDQGLDYLKSSGANEFVSNLGGSVKQNPVPVALVGIGLAWLMAGGNRRPGYLQQGASAGPGMAQRASESLSSGMSAAKERISSAKERLSQSAAGARERGGQMGQAARHQADRLRSTYESMREQPFALGALGLALGAAIAAAAPRTRKEDELMGETKDRLAERAKSMGQEQMEKMQHGAQPSSSGPRTETPARPPRTEISATSTAASPAPARETPGRPRA